MFAVSSLRAGRSYRIFGFGHVRRSSAHRLRRRSSPASLLCRPLSVLASFVSEADDPGVARGAQPAASLALHLIETAEEVQRAGRSAACRVQNTRCAYPYPRPGRGGGGLGRLACPGEVPTRVYARRGPINQSVCDPPSLPAGWLVSEQACVCMRRDCCVRV